MQCALLQSKQFSLFYFLNQKERSLCRHTCISWVCVYFYKSCSCSCFIYAMLLVLERAFSSHTEYLEKYTDADFSLSWAPLRQQQAMRFFSKKLSLLEFLKSQEQLFPRGTHVHDICICRFFQLLVMCIFCYLLYVLTWIELSFSYRSLTCTNAKQCALLLAKQFSLL